MQPMLIFAVAWTAVITLVTPVKGWVPTHVAIPSRLSLGATSNVLGGVSEFEKWFKDTDKATSLSSIQHQAFGALRGLACQESVNGIVLTVPKTVVLSSSYGDDDWDSQLAVKLWTECMRGSQSSIYGYCALLARGEPISANSVPPSTAPNTLRHWTEDQLAELSRSPKGQKLRELQTRQEQQWRNKYVAVKDTMSWDQFQWCMEVVHSRAFRGNYGLSPFRTIFSAAAPIAAAAIGIAYIQGNPDVSDSVLLGLASLAISPFLVNVAVPDKGDVVLLPYIDSANHLEEADSAIQYDPLGGVFSLSVGPKCLVREGTEAQLYISYGPRSEGELLLNYGFLPGILSSDIHDQSANDAHRRKLAQEFVKVAL